MVVIVARVVESGQAWIPCHLLGNKMRAIMGCDKRGDSKGGACLMSSKNPGRKPGGKHGRERRTDNEPRVRTDFTDPAFRNSLYDILLENAGNVGRTCRMLEIHRRSLYDALQRDADFKRDFEKVRDDAIELAEDELRRRAIDGVDKGIWFQGERVGTEKVYSDALLRVLLAAHRKRYRARLEHTGEDGDPIQLHASVVIELPDNGRGKD